MEISSDDQFVYVQGELHIAKISSENGVIVKSFNKNPPGAVDFNGLSITDTRLLVGGVFTLVFDIDTFAKLLQIDIVASTVLILSNGDYLVDDLNGLCIFNETGGKVWRVDFGFTSDKVDLEKSNSSAFWISSD